MARTFAYARVPGPGARLDTTQPVALPITTDRAA